MKIFIPAEGTILVHQNGSLINRGQRVRQSKAAGIQIQRERRQLALATNSPIPVAPKGGP